MEITINNVKNRNEPYQLFLDSIRSPSTLRRYKNLLYTFLKLIPNKIYLDYLDKEDMMGHKVGLEKHYEKYQEEDFERFPEYQKAFHF